MGKALDAARAHYRALVDMKPYIDVPEWQVPIEGAAEGLPQTKPLRIYYKPLTLQDRALLQKDIEDDNFAALMIARALDETGEKLFEVADEELLKRSVASHVVQRVGILLTSMPKLTVEDARGN